MKRIISLALVLCLILALSTGVAADNGKQYDYSTTANSGKRHEVCTSLLGTRADSYYTGEYTYDQLSQLSGDRLLNTLKTLMTSTHHKNSTYNDCRDMAVKTDCENGDGTSINLLYTSYSSKRSDFDGSSGWNREHVWPKSLGGFETSGAGGDLHHIRPADSKVNSTRGNMKYGNVSVNGKEAVSNYFAGYAVGGRYAAGFFEPHDNVKGDVARICLYVYVRYNTEHSKCSKITNVFQSVDVLLEWCALDPVDTWEMGRNEVVAAYQGNRNVFIDYPELAWLLFDQAIPTDMTTPSGEAANYTPSACTHSHTEIRNEKNATCTETGYTGDTYCSDCGEKLSGGSSIKALGHVNADGNTTCDRCGTAMECSHQKTEVRNAKEATCEIDGFTGDTYCTDCGTQLSTGEAIPAGSHSFGDWTVTKDATTEEAGQQERTCGTCGYVESQSIPKLEPAPTDPTDEPTVVPTVPGSSETKPAETTADTDAPDAPADEEPEADNRWLVFVVIGIGAVVSIVIVVIQMNRKKK